MIVKVEACGCPNVCRHCAEDGRPPYGGHFTLEELRALHAGWGPLWPLHEPSAHPQFPEILGADIVSEVGFLSTNGFGFARSSDGPVVLRRLRDMGYTFMSFTVHGLASHHDWFVGRRGAFDDIVAATRRAREAGFGLHWNVWLDRKNLEQMPAVVSLAEREVGGSPYLSVPNHRVSQRLWRYERLRPSVADLNSRLPRDLVRKGCSPLQEGETERFGEAEWLRMWRDDPKAEAFRFSLDPEEWPPAPSDRVAILITRERGVYLSLHSDLPIFLGHLAEGRDAILQRLQNLPEPIGLRLEPASAKLPPEDALLVHARGFSVRFKAASCLYEDVFVEHNR